MQSAMHLRLRSSAIARSTRRSTGLRAFTSTSRPQGLFTKDRDDTVDPNKERTDSIAQAKDERGATPATQQANVIKQQNPGDPGQKTPNPGQTQANMDKGHTPGGLANKKDPGQKSGEEAVNPAVKS